MPEFDLDATKVGTRLGLGDDFRPWLEELEQFGPPDSPVHLPEPNEIDDLFAHLGVSPIDAAAIIDNWPHPAQNPAGWWLLQRCYQQLVAMIGKPYDTPRLWWRTLPSQSGASGRLFYVYVFLAALPAIRQWHHEQGIPDAVSWATLADLGEQIAIYQRIFGVTGLDVPDWLTLHFTGSIFRLGRLQFERWRLSPRWSIYDNVDGGDAEALKPRPASPALSVHIPESGGPLSPDACSESFARARTFFARHFPEETYHFARCSSWLLDPQLADYLPPTSNIIRFQRRFHLVPGGTNDDESVLRFVFRRVGWSLAALPQRTTLERAVVSHLQAGKHWQFYSGWLVL